MKTVILLLSQSLDFVVVNITRKECIQKHHHALFLVIFTKIQATVVIIYIKHYK